jgi:branched-chain amino acid transport system substrate-binding protein
MVTGIVCGGLATAGAGTSEPGVTKDSIKLGYIFSETGAAGTVYKNAGKACQARVDRQNREGGVHGRKIDLILRDDQTSTANLTAAKDLVESDNVFAVVNNSPLAFVSYRYLLGQGVALVGGGYDGTYYGEQGNENIISALGNSVAVDGLTYDTTAKIMKSLGATKEASVAYGNSPSSSASAKAEQQYASAAQGLKDTYLNTSLNFGDADVGPVVLGLKNSGADGVYLAMDNDTNFAIVQGLKQNNVPVKANVLATGYGQALLDQPAAKAMNPKTDVLLTLYRPVELGGKAVKQLQADRAKVGLKGVPDYGEYTGYIACDLAIRGLEEAGANPTREAFTNGIRGLATYDGAGLSCAPIDVSREHFGALPATGCTWAVTVKGDKFVVLNKGKPYVGKLVGDPKLLAENKVGTVLATTTTAPAS